MLYKGSYAQKQYDSNYRNFNDIDIVIPNNYKDVNKINYIRNFFKNTRVEVHKIEDDIYDIFKRDSISCYLSESHLYTLKLSHSRYDVFYEKTTFDVVYYQRRGVEIDEELYDKLLNYWEIIHGKNKRLSLNRTKEQFFNNAVVCPIEHDKIHEIVAYYDKPLYTTVLKNNEEVLIDWDKFSKLSHLDKVRMLREEIYAIAMERWGIPSNFQINSGICYHKALKKVFLDLTKNKFQDFIARNLIYLIDKDGSDWYRSVKQFAEDNNIDCK